MNHSPQWPVLHILLGIPVVLSVSFLWGGSMKGWGLGDETILTSATLVAVVGASYTFLVTVVERSYYMVFWAREKIKSQWEEARRDAQAKGMAEGLAEGKAEGMAEGVTKGAAKSHESWRAWYERMQAAQREGRPFDEPPPDAPGRGEDS